MDLGGGWRDAGWEEGGEEGVGSGSGLSFFCFLFMGWSGHLLDFKILEISGEIYLLSSTCGHVFDLFEYQRDRQR